MENLLEVQGKNPNGRIPGGLFGEAFRANAAGGVQRRILVVEDDLDTARSWTYLLQTSGHLVEYAINGFAALKLAGVFLPQVIILDLRLPDYHGAELVRRLREHPELKQSYIISVTGSTDEMDRVRAFSAGCDEILTKPVRIRALEELIARFGSR